MNALITSQQCRPRSLRAVLHTRKTHCNQHVFHCHHCNTFTDKLRCVFCVERSYFYFVIELSSSRVAYLRFQSIINTSRVYEARETFKTDKRLADITLHTQCSGGVRECGRAPLIQHCFVRSLSEWRRRRRRPLSDEYIVDCTYYQ